MAKLLMTNSGRGQELCDLLRTELGVPERTRSMSVTFTAGEPVVVACEFFPVELPEPDDDDPQRPDDHRGLNG
ncbi:MAG: hypothetical protein JSR41_24730 [Proteobacteria bacterium]|nr:hypothetical protein [Pseudomonadota bacterium]